MQRGAARRAASVVPSRLANPVRLSRLCRSGFMSSRRRLRPGLSVLALEDRVTPAGVPTQWVARGAGGGGALFSPQFNPANPNEIYVASDMSQVFRTSDAGANW